MLRIGYAVDPAPRALGQSRPTARASRRVQMIAAVAEKMRAGHVERQCCVLAGPQPRLGEWRSGSTRSPVRCSCSFGPKPPSSPTSTPSKPCILQRAREGAVDGNRHFQRFGIGAGADGQKQEVLKIEIAARVQAAADEVDHRQRQAAPGSSTSRYRHSGSCRRRGGGVGAGQRYAEDGVGPEPRLVRRAVELAQDAVDVRPGAPADWPSNRGAISVVTLRRPCGRLCRHSAAGRRRAARPLRAGRCWPPTARWPGPQAPPSQKTSTSTVGLPRLSRTSRARMRVMLSDIERSASGNRSLFRRLFPQHLRQSDRGENCHERAGHAAAKHDKIAPVHVVERAAIARQRGLVGGGIGMATSSTSYSEAGAGTVTLGIATVGTGGGFFAAFGASAGLAGSAAAGGLAVGFAGPLTSLPTGMLPEGGGAAGSVPSTWG